MPQRLTITTMGKQTLMERLEDRIYGALMELPLTATDEERAKKAALAVTCEGNLVHWPDHGSRDNPSS